MAPRRAPADDAEGKLPIATTARRPSSGAVPCLLVLYSAILLVTGYLVEDLLHRVASSSAAKLVAVPGAAQHATADTGLRSPGRSGDNADAAPAVVDQQLLLPESADRTLRFEVAGGFAQQRLALVYGMLLAKRLRRAAVLPEMVDREKQQQRRHARGTSAAGGGSDNTQVQVAFEEMYDLPYFVARMRRAGLRVLPPLEAPPASSYTSVQLGSAARLAMLDLGGPNASVSVSGALPHLSVGCPLFALTPSDLGPEDYDFIWAVLEGLRPSAQASVAVDRVIDAIAGSAHSATNTGAAGTAAAGRFNFLHLRIENEWLKYCKSWESHVDGAERDNCYAHTDAIDERLALFGVNTSLPLYVASYWPDVNPGRRDRILSRLSSAGHRLVIGTSTSSIGKSGAARGADAEPALVPELKGRGREFAALVEYFVGQRAERFMGNSVSTCGALALLERRHGGRWAAYYNGGNIPLTSRLPGLYRLPWVFVYNAWAGDAYDYMMKAAVRSAAATRSLQPFCLFLGDTNTSSSTNTTSSSAGSPSSSSSSSRHAWLVWHNVTIINHRPSWVEQLLQAARATPKDIQWQSHLHKAPHMIVATFQRVDLPVLPDLDQFTYVLYTDTDVYFRKPIRLDDFGLPLPRSVSMSHEMEKVFPYNAGIIVANLPVMRQRYPDFMQMVLNGNPGMGLHFKGYGPLDQGAINKFYEADLRERMLSQLFNAKPYDPFSPSAFIVHFHGPKPHELADWIRTGKCAFSGKLCEKMVVGSFCRYAPEWARFLSDEPVAVWLNDTCAVLASPVFKRLQAVAAGRRLLYET